MKKIFGVLTSMAMALALLVMPVRAEGNVTNVGSEEELTAAINNNAQSNIVLTQDITVNNTIIISDGKNVMIDLAGYKIAFGLNKHFEVDGGSISVNGQGKVYEEKPNYAPIMVKGSVNDKPNYSSVYVGKDVLLEGWAGVFINKNSIDNSKALGINITVEGSINAKRDTANYVGAGIYINGSISETKGNVPKISLTETCKIDAIGEGIYAAGYAQWFINGSEIKGTETGVEIRAGKMEINNAKITGYGTPTDVTPNGNGSTSTGCGLALAQHSTKLPIDVTINGGTISGYSALYESTPQEDPNINVIKLEVNNGSFKAINGGTVSVYCEDLTKFISGGTFSPEPDAKYLADGCKSYKVSDAEYKVAPVATTVTLDKSELTLNLKDTTTATLTATLEPKTTLDTVTWSTSDATVATVDQAGKVTAVKEGAATIKATVNGKEATCTVTVLGNRTVTFDNEGTKTTATVVKGEKVAEPTAPTKEGYTFVGWYNGAEKYDFTKPVTDNLTLTAKWTINTYTVTFSDGVTAQKVEHGKLVTEPQAPTKEGYTFVGWYNGKEKYDFTKPVTKDLTLTAEWKVVPGKEEVEVPTIDPKEPVEEVTIGVANQGKTETILTESIKDETLKEAIEEKIADGIDVNTVVNVDLVKPEETSEEVKKDIEKVIAAAKENNVEVAQYLDINIKVMAGDEELGKITTTTEKLTFQVAVPEELKKEGRTFIVIRVHDGKVEELKTVEKDGMLIFETDKFSTYALTYKDAEPTKPATKPTTPNTSDMSMIVTFGILTLLSGAAFIVLKKKEA